MLSSHALLHQKIMRDQLSSLQQYRVNLLLLVLVVFPFINIFGKMENVLPLFEPSSLKQVINYMALLGCIFVFLLQKPRFSVKLLLSVFTLLAMLFINYLFAPLASIKWLFNWLGFIFIGLMTAQIVKSFTGPEMRSLQIKVLKMVRFILIILTTLVAFVWITNSNDLMMFVSSGRHNNTIYSLSANIGLEKQALGTFLVLLVILALTHWRIIPKSTRFIFIIFFLVIWPAMLGIRTMWLALGLCVVWIYFTKNRIRQVAAYAACLGLIAIFVSDHTGYMEFVSEVYDRLASLKFAWSAMTFDVFGLGNGGYHVYVEKHNDTLLAQFGSELMNNRGYFWTAPESDLVYFIASWGILSPIFYGFFAYLLLRGGHILHGKIEILQIERAILLMAGAMIFMGISQDNAGKLIWWVYMAAGFGVILRQRGQCSKAIKSQGIQHQTSQQTAV